MKAIVALALIFSSYFSFSQTDEITVPENTLIPMELTQEVKEGKNKVGEAARFVVTEDIKVNGAVVISKNTLVHATVTTSKRGELKVDVYDVAATDGTVIKLNDCWLFTTFAQNYVTHGALLVKGTKKNCTTVGNIKIKKGGGKF
jgi:hypothetical protein